MKKSSTDIQQKNNYNDSHLKDIKNKNGLKFFLIFI